MTFNRSQYQRNTSTSGRVVNTGPPRTNTGLTGLGAVGGPRGVGAGALRVIVEFLTEYDAKQLKQLEQELDRLQAQETKHHTRMQSLRKSEAASQGALTRLQNIQQRAQFAFTRAQLREIKEIRDLERSRVRGSKAQADAQKQLLATQTGFRKQEISQLVNADRIQHKAMERRAKWAAAIAKEEAKITATQKQQQAVQQRVGFMQNMRANVLPKLGSLALGAAGGIFGGALVGVGFAAAQALIDGIGTALSNILDPGKEARQTLEDVTEQINKLASGENITLLEATRQILRDMGQLGRGMDADVLATAAAWKTVRDELAEAYRLQKLIADELNKQRRDEAIQERFSQLLAQNRDQLLPAKVRSPTGAESADIAAVKQRLLAQATREVDDAFNRATAGASGLAAAEQRLAQAGAAAAIGQQQLIQALGRISSMRIGGLQDQLSALGSSGPSARTQGLERQIAGMQEAQAQAAYGAQLRNIQEERGLVLLEQRIRFQGESVRMDQLSARGQIIAINARIEGLQRAGELEQDRLDALNKQISAMRKADQAQDKRDQDELKVYDDRIAAIRKQGDAQDRLNRLLDLQYRMGQRINRNEGESIGDFLARRANEQRQLLAEQSALRRDDAVSVIEEERDKVAAVQETANARREAAIEAKELEAERLQAVIEANQKAREAEIRALQQRQEQLQLEVRLQELAEQEKQLAAQETARRQMQSLQDQLRASQEADAAALKSRQESIEAQIKAEEEKQQRLAYWANQENITRLQMAVAGADSLGELQYISGEVQGAKRVLGELRALVRAGVLPQYMVGDRIAQLVAIIRSAEAKMTQHMQIGANIRSPRAVPMASGGVFALNNAMNNPFGANIRTGEGGQEIGVVLSNRVARILQETQKPAGSQTFIFPRSEDHYRDKQRFKGAVKEAMNEVLR